LLELIVAFVVGLVVGSFLNVCIVRIPLEESIVRPRSHCRDCQTPVAWYDNIPVVSWIALGGRCRRCRERIPFRYPMVEVLTGALFVMLVARGFPPKALALFAALGSALIVITFIDIDYLIIPDVISLPSIAVSPVAAFVVGHISVLDSLIGIAVGGGILWGVAWAYERVRDQEGMGFGDVKLLAMIGGLLGWGAALFTTLAAALLGSVIGVAMVLWRRSRMDVEIPFGPFLAIGALLWLAAGPELTDWYLYRTPLF
jgi:leader peptidase (prepilin peptidase)/N-methyltransferase